MSMFIGEALVGEGNEIAHIDLLIGSKDGPVGTAFANALANQSQGHTNLLAVLEQNPSVSWTDLVGRVEINEDADPNFESMEDGEGEADSDDDLTTFRL